ncbi:protease inhibitor Inh/omp19 family protein [Pseudaminobacter sp. 19-2017]|uniref:Protease inhibitor Inh/omp19 family protein n=1 Tax=Pseudaminobacter soli (ex Zhang et al. 2022) TaxID=2831468 RepID=A0A942DWJ0_9HYPH|nr:protease inhibitor Inh/omp19 family protein [Pseudaminobacter soli]MBS3647947.1 protease inhibitor Inh/omp19 family protein [Pseudaminobacter soli]
MVLFRTGVLFAVVAALAISGCQSSRFSAPDAGPTPLPAAPAGQVTSNQLPPPVAPGGATTDFPAAPGTMGDQMAAATPAAPPAGAPDLTPSSVGGVWTVSVSGQSCKIATSQTKYGQGYRAGPLRCPAPVDGVKSWAVAGKQLSLYDENGGVMARLYSSGPEKFDGQTESGVPISLSR